LSDLAGLVEMCCVGVFIVTCKLGLAVGLALFQLCVHSFILYIYSVSKRRVQYFDNCIAKPCHVGHPLFNAQKFDGNALNNLIQ